MIAENENFAVEKEADIGEWLEKMPEVAILGKFGTVFVKGENTPLFGPALWQKIAREIYNRLPHYDGFVVTSPLNDVLYNSIAISFALKKNNKPVIFTGAQQPVFKKTATGLLKASSAGLGIKSNLINALGVAGKSLDGVGLMFGHQCLRAVRAQRSDPDCLEAFIADENSFLAKIDFGMSRALADSSVLGHAGLADHFSGNVLSLCYYSGLDIGLVEKISASCSGLMVQSLPIEPFSKDFLLGLASLKKPVLVYNRFYLPKLNHENLIEVFSLTKETALIKFMWALGKTQKPSLVRSLLESEFCGEFL